MAGQNHERQKNGGRKMNRMGLTETKETKMGKGQKDGDRE